MKSAQEIRARFVFDIARLREAAGRLQSVDERLATLRRKLEARAESLTRDAAAQARRDGEATITLSRAKAQASALLARRAALLEVLGSRSYLSIIAAMALGRWIEAMRGLSRGPSGESAIGMHVEAGRVAYRLLSSLRRQKGLTGGVGQLVAAVVVGELASDADQAHVDVQLEEGLYRARAAGLDDDRALGAASLALREAAELIERMADYAEPAVRLLVEEADTLEQKVEVELLRGAR